MTAPVTESKGIPLQETRDPRSGEAPGEPADHGEQDREATPSEDELADIELAGGASDPAGSESPPTPEVIDYKDRWLRAEAELQNFRRRVRRDIEESGRRAEEAVLLDLLSLLDDLERAHRAAGESGAPAPWSEGVALVLQKGRDYLERQDVQAVDPVGQPFDPRFHEAILEMDAPDDVAPGTVMQVVHRGYRRGERALRPARVVVARSRTDEA